MEYINLEDYEVVPAIYFVDRTKPTLMITDGTVLLNNSSLNRLKDAEYVQFMLSEKHKSVLVRSCSKTDEGATEFKTSGNKPKKIKHKILTDRIFEIAKWDTTKKYCSVGYLKKFDECSALIFDISAVKELPLKQDRKTNVENKKQSAKIVKF